VIFRKSGKPVIFRYRPSLLYHNNIPAVSNIASICNIASMIRGSTQVPQAGQCGQRLQTPLSKNADLLKNGGAIPVGHVSPNACVQGFVTCIAPARKTTRTAAEAQSVDR